MTTRPILLTGFGRYGRTPVNPAEEVVSALSGTQIGGVEVIGRTIENSFDVSVAQVLEAIESCAPRLVVMLGEYGGRAVITVERLATNWDDSARYGLADNRGAIRAGVQPVPGAAVALASTAPVRLMVQAMRNAGVPADLSETAGTNVCNHLFFRVLHETAGQRPVLPVAWIHLPHLPEVAALEENLGAPSMAVVTAVTGVRAAIGAVLDDAGTAEPMIRTRWQI